MPMIFGKTSGGIVVPVQVDAAGALIVSTLPAGANLIGRVDARGGDKIFSFKQAIHQVLNFNAVAGNNFPLLPVVPANTVWVMNVISLVNNVTAVRMIIYVSPGASVFYDAVQGIGIYAFHANGEIVLGPGEGLGATLIACAAGDPITFEAHGYAMGL